MRFLDRYTEEDWKNCISGKCNLEHCNFTECNLNRVNFLNAKLLNCESINCNLTTIYSCIEAKEWDKLLDSLLHIESRLLISIAKSDVNNLDILVSMVLSDKPTCIGFLNRLFELGLLFRNIDGTYQLNHSDFKMHCLNISINKYWVWRNSDIRDRVYVMLNNYLTAMQNLGLLNANGDQLSAKLSNDVKKQIDQY